MKEYKFILPVQPTPKQSFRVSKHGAKYQSKKVKDMHDAMVLLLKTQLPSGFKLLSGPVHIDYTFIYKYRKAQPKYHREGKVYKVTVPDFDNLLKAINDAIKDVIVIDDNVICSGTFEKIFGIEDKIIIKVKQLDDLYY